MQTQPTYKVLANEWPYGIDPDISHLVVWTRFGFEEDAVTGDSTDRAMGLIEGFVREKFCDGGDAGQEGLERDNWCGLRIGLP